MTKCRGTPITTAPGRIFNSSRVLVIDSDVELSEVLGEAQRRGRVGRPEAGDVDQDPHRPVPSPDLAAVAEHDVELDRAGEQIPVE